MNIALFLKVTYRIKILLKKNHILYCFSYKVTFSMSKVKGGGQHLEWPIFRKFEKYQIEITKVEFYKLSNFKNFLIFETIISEIWFFFLVCQ